VGLSVRGGGKKKGRDWLRGGREDFHHYSAGPGSLVRIEKKGQPDFTKEPGELLIGGNASANGRKGVSPTQIAPQEGGQRDKTKTGLPRRIPQIQSKIMMQGCAS